MKTKTFFPWFIPGALHGPGRCATGLLLAIAVDAGAVELPEPLSAAISRLRSASSYVWTQNTELPGAPFSVAPIQGWSGARGEGLMEATVDGKSVQVAILGACRTVKLDSAWKAPAEIAPAKDLQTVEAARLLKVFAPAEALHAHLLHATTIRGEADGSFSVELDADAAAEIVGTPMKDLPKRGPAPEIKAAAASIQFWVKDGALQRYVISSHANLSLPIGNREIRQSTVVELREIDATEATLPPEARSKLQAMTLP